MSNAPRTRSSKSKNPKLRIIYIHGANSTYRSFAYMREKLGGSDLMLDYQSPSGFFNNLEVMANILNSLDKTERFFLIGHSLGGLYALHLLERMRPRIIGGFTLSTPYGGSELAHIARFIAPTTRLLRDVSPAGKPVTSSKSIRITVPWTNIVSTMGTVSWIMGPNDGVVSVASMKGRPDMDLIEKPLNHFEVVMEDEIIELIRKQIESSVAEDAKRASQ